MIQVSKDVPLEQLRDNLEDIQIEMSEALRRAVKYRKAHNDYRKLVKVVKRRISRLEWEESNGG